MKESLFAYNLTRKNKLKKFNFYSFILEEIFYLILN